MLRETLVSASRVLESFEGRANLMPIWRELASSGGSDREP
jgi:hypothetical protein